MCACDRIQARIQDYLQARIWYKLWTRFEYIQGMVQVLQGIIQALVQDLQAGGIDKLHQILDI